jgi:hypothetical protein
VATKKIIAFYQEKYSGNPPPAPTTMTRRHQVAGKNKSLQFRLFLPAFYI